MRTAAAAGALVLGLLADAAGAGGDAQRGQQAYEARCGGCHSVQADRVGPRHAGIVGRRAGSVSGFEYSEALRRSGLTWDPALLDLWLADPEALVPGQRMGYRLGDAQLRADIVAYLGTLVAPGR
jgi:cytochrome c